MVRRGHGQQPASRLSLLMPRSEGHQIVEGKGIGEKEVEREKPAVYKIKIAQGKQL